MADLIERDRLLRYIDSMSIDDNSNNLVFKIANTVLSMFKQVIEAMPKADTERHAHWIYDGDDAFCSNCGTVFFFKKLAITEEEHKKKNPYCKICGCRMDEVSNGKDDI